MQKRWRATKKFKNISCFLFIPFYISSIEPEKYLKTSHVFCLFPAVTLNLFTIFYLKTSHVFCLFPQLNKSSLLKIFKNISCFLFIFFVQESHLFFYHLKTSHVFCLCWLNHKHWARF